jgi:hypothetical protein
MGAGFAFFLAARFGSRAEGRGFSSILPRPPDEGRINSAGKTRAAPPTSAQRPDNREVTFLPGLWSRHLRHYLKDYEPTSW